MKHCLSISPANRQGGVSIITAIFFLLLFASLAAFMAHIMAEAHLSSARDVGGAKAYQAARGGVEWALYQLDPNAQSSSLPSCPSGTLTAIPDHSVAVTCVAYPSATTYYREGSKTIRIFQITATATATSALAPGIERQIVVTVEKCRDTTMTVAPYDC